MDRKQIERDIEVLEGAFEVASRIQGSSSLYCKLQKTISQLQSGLQATERTQREFKNKDFHVIVWEDSERIGIETKWIKEGFVYRGGSTGNIAWLSINGAEKTDVIDDVLPHIGTEKHEMLKSKIRDYTYSDIVKELEKADKLSREVSIWDVIEECKGVTDRGLLGKILDKYEIISYDGYTYKLTDNKNYLGNAIGFVMDGYQLRLKEVE